MHGNEIVQYLQNYKRLEFDQGHSKKLLQSSTSYIQIENTKTTRLQPVCLTFKLTLLWLYFGKSCKITLFRKPTEVSENSPTFISTRPPITKQPPFRNMKNLSFFWRLLFFKKNYWRLEFLTNQIFWFIVFEKLSYRGQLLLKLRVIEVATSFHWISSRSIW